MNVVSADHIPKKRAPIKIPIAYIILIIFTLLINLVTP